MVKKNITFERWVRRVVLGLRKTKIYLIIRLFFLRTFHLSHLKEGLPPFETRNNKKTAADSGSHFRERGRTLCDENKYATRNSMHHKTVLEM